MQTGFLVEYRLSRLEFVSCCLPICDYSFHNGYTAVPLSTLKLLSPWFLRELYCNLYVLPFSALALGPFLYFQPSFLLSMPAFFGRILFFLLSFLYCSIFFSFPSFSRFLLGITGAAMLEGDLLQEYLFSPANFT